MEATRQRVNVAILQLARCRVEIWMLATECIRYKGEEVELHRQTVVTRSHQERLDGAQSVLTHGFVGSHDQVPTAPHPAADHVEARRSNLLHVLVPHVGIRLGEVEAMNVTRHVRGADDGERLAIQFKVVAADGELLDPIADTSSL